MNIHALPKAELHCHLEGILNLEMAREIRSQNPDFPVDVEAFASSYPVEGVDAFYHWFENSRSIFQEPQFFEPIIKRHVSRLREQNVHYSEIMAGGGLPPKGLLEAEKLFRSFKRWADEAASGVVRIEFLVTIARTLDPFLVEQWTDTAIALHERGLIVGVALAGPERGHPVKPFQKSFARLREAGLGIEIHAGEECGPESVWDAIRYGQPHRIGHGIAVFQDVRLIDEVLERWIHVELCPTSNLMTGGVVSIEAHPITLARTMGVSFSINTDDPGAFGSSMESEFELLADRCQFDERQFREVYAHSMAARFGF